MKNGQSVCGEPMESLPRNRGALLDRRRRSVRRAAAVGIVNQAGGQGQALFPAAGELARELLPAIRQSKSLEAFLDRLPALGHPIDAGDEVEVLLDGQVFVEAEALGHVTDLALDLGRFRRISRPRQLPLPSSGVSRPQSMRMNVVLPLPFGPRKP